MKIQTLIKHVPSYQKDLALAALLSMLETSTGELDVDKDPHPDHLVALLQDYATRLLEVAETNLANIALVNEGEEGALDDLVHDNSSDIGSEVNNGGFSEQVKYLVVELGMPVDKIQEGIDAGSDGIREIPR